MGTSPSWEAVDLLLRIARDATKGSTFRERLDAIADPLSVLIPNTSISAVVIGSDSKSVNAWFRNGVADHAIEYATHYLPFDPMRQPCYTSPGAPVRLSDVVVSRGAGADPFTGEFLPRHGLKHVLGFVQPVPGAHLAFALHRERGTRDFSRIEVEFLKRAAQDLTRGVFWSLLREEVERLVADERGRAVALVFDEAGEVRDGDPEAMALFAQLRIAEPTLERWAREEAQRIERRGEECGTVGRVFAARDGTLVRVRVFILSQVGPAARRVLIMQALQPGSPTFMEALATRARLTCIVPPSR